MEWFSSEWELINLGEAIERIHEEADRQFNGGLIADQDGWAGYVNSQMEAHPAAILLQSGAEEAVLQYKRGLDRIRQERKPGLTALTGLFSAIFSPIGAAGPVVSLFGTKAAYDNFKNSSSLNKGITHVLSNYRLVSVIPSGIGLKRGRHDVVTSFSTGATVTFSGSGIHLDERVSLDG